MRFVVLGAFLIFISVKVAEAQEPICNASGLGSPSQTNNSITLTWNPGCGSERLVLMAPAFTPPCFPVDFVSYGQDNNYSSAPTVCAGWRSVFSGPGTSVIVNGLSSGTAYDVMVFEFGIGPDYRVGDQAFGTFSTSGGGGGVQAGLSLSSVGAGQVTLAVIVGNDQATLVAAQEGSSFTGIPINNQKYCAQPIFPNGQNIPGGGYAVGLQRHGICGAAVICSETTTTFNVTGLTPGTTYTFRAFEFDGCSSPTYNINLGPGNPLTVNIPFTEPSTQASNLTFSLVTTSTMTVTWTSGNGQNRILVGRAGSAVSFVPQDGQAYSASADFNLAADQGSGNKVLYAGSANSVALTNLMPGITYHFQVFESNGPTFDSFTNYLTSTTAGNPSSRPTFFAEPTSPAVAYNASSVATTSMTLGWTNGNGAGRIVLMDDSPFAFMPTDGTTYTANSIYTSGLDLGSGTKCVYNGVGSSVAITGLSAGTTYHFLVVEYNGSGLSTNYMAIPGPITPFGSLYSQPSTTPVNITFSAVTPADMIVGWTNGNGSHRILVARAGAAVSFTPTDGVNYTGNPNFLLAADQGSGNKVVYSGSGNSVPITGLTPNTVYHFQVFESNPAGGGTQSNYLVSPGTGNPASRSTLDSEPVSQANSLLFSNVQAQSMTLGWASGSGTSRIVIADDAAIAFVPVDGVTYPANSNYSAGTDLGGGQKCVYNGTGGSVSVTGLSPNTTYTFRIFEYNGAALTANYLVSTGVGNPDSRITLVAEPTVQATTLSFTAPATNGLTINWTPGNGTSRVVIMDDAAVTFTPTDGTTLTANTNFASGTDLGSGQKCVYDGSSNTVNVTGLAANTTYHFRVFEYNGTTTQTNYLTTSGAGNPATRKTLFAEPTAHAASFTATPASSPQNNLAFSAAGTISAFGYIVLRRTDGVNPTTAGVNDGTAPGALPLAAGTTLLTNVSSAATSSFNDTGLLSGAQYNYALIPYSYDGTNSETYNYRTAATVPVANATTFVVEPTAQPTAIVFSSVTPNSFTVSFTAPASPPAGYIAFRKVASSPVTAIPTDGNVLTPGATVGDGTVAYVGTNPTFNESGLTPGTVYFYDIFAYNGSGALTNYLTSGPLEGSQTTLVNPPINQPTAFVISALAADSYTASFTASVGGADGYLIVRRTGLAPTGTPTDGQVYPVGGSLTDGTVVAVGSSVSIAESGLTSNTTYYYAIFAFNGSGGAINYLSASPLTGSQLTLPQAPNLLSASAIGQTGFTATWDAIAGITNFFIDVSTDNFSTFVTGYQNKAVTGTTEVVNGVASGTTFGFRLRAGNAAGQSTNSTTQTALTKPATPTPGTPTATQTSITATWTAVTGAANYHLDIATDAAFTNFVAGHNDLSLSPATLSVTVSSLPSGTTYYYRVRASNATGASPSSSSVEVPTIPATPAIEIPTDNRTSNSFLVTWSAVPGATAYYLDVFDITTTPVAVPGYQNKAVTGTFHNVIGLNPSTNYQVVLRSSNSSGSSPDSPTKFTQTKDASGNETNPAPTVALGSTASTTSVSAVLSFGTDPKTVVFFHRKITDPADHSAEDPVQQGSGTLTVDVQSSFLDELGMEYYFEVTDFVGRKSTSPKGYVYRSVSSQAIPNLSSGGRLENYRIFSLPIDFGSNNSIVNIFLPVSTQFSGTSKEKWRIVRYQNKKNVDYPEGLITIDKGKGYWFNSVEPIDLQLSGGVIQANQNSDFQLALEDGWNQIGNPFTFDISWADVRASNPSVGPLYIYNPAVKFDQSDNLKAWGGGFVRSTGPSTLTIPVTVARASGRVSASQPLAKALDGEEWFVPLTLQQGEASNDLGGIGMSPSASPSLDKLDELSLPRFVRYLELNSDHPEHEWRRFMRDMVPTSAAHTWNLNVESNWESPEITVRWDNKDFGANEAQLLLYDMESQMFVDMRLHDHYTFANAGPRSLKVIYARTAADFVPGFTDVGQPYPNPFRTQVRIPVVLQESASVDFSVFDVTGRKVGGAVIPGLTAGVHYLEWDGLGGTLPDGLYVYRVRLSDGTQRQGRIILRKD